MAWTIVTNVGFGFTVRTQMGRLPNEREVYEVLRTGITAPGVYVANPALDDQGQFPAGEPVFGIRYAGFGHEGAGRTSLVGLALWFASAWLAACLLALASPRVLRRYWGRVGFVALAGVLLAVSGELVQYGIAGYSAGLALVIGANRLGAWLLAALIMGWAFGSPVSRPAAPPAGSP